MRISVLLAILCVATSAVGCGGGDGGPDPADSVGEQTEPETHQCTPVCLGKECGDDGCGGSCGQCIADKPICGADFKCAGDCTSVCEGRVCGGDGCGGSCGECPDGQFCNEGQCSSDCVSDPGCTIVGLKQCADGAAGAQSCADVGEGCLKWGDPEPCGEGFSCQAGECIEDCVADCEGKACGGDGCGGCGPHQLIRGWK